MRERMTLLERTLAATENEYINLEYLGKMYEINCRSGKGWYVSHAFTNHEWGDELHISSNSYGSVDGKYYQTKEELLQTATIEGRPLIEIIRHYEEEYGTEKNPRPPQKLTYERLKKVPDRYPIGRIQIQIANQRCVERREYKVTPHNYYDDPFWVELEWEEHDDQGNRLYSVTVSKLYEATIFKLEDLYADEVWQIFDQMTIYDKTFEEHCNAQENNDLVQIFVGA